MRAGRHGRFGPGTLLGLAVFTLVLLLSPAQHDDFGPDAVPGHCHACTASPVASLVPDCGRDLHPLLPVSGEAVPLSERAQGLLCVFSASGRAPPDTL